MGWEIIEQNEQIDAELHLVHRSPIDQSLAVIAVLLRAQAKNVPFFKFLTALEKKVHAYDSVSHVEGQQLEDGLGNNPFAFIEDDSEGTILNITDGDEGEDYDEKEGDEGEDDEEEDTAEYNEEDKTDFSSQDFDAEPDTYDEDENQVDVNMNTVETINIHDTLDKGTNHQNNNNDNKNANQQPIAVNSNDNENNNIDNNQDNNQDTNVDTDDAAVSAAAAAENCKLPPIVDNTICTGVPPTDEETTHIDLPLKSIDFSPLVKTVKGFTNRWEYEGSLTTPPCSEHVSWNVMHESFPIGLEQLRALVDLQGYNAREINEDPQAKREPVA